MNNAPIRPQLSLHMQVLLLYGSYSRLDDLFAMQARGTYQVSSAEFDEALAANQALSTIVQQGLREDNVDADALREQLSHSSIGPIADLARASTRRPRS